MSDYTPDVLQKIRDAEKKVSTREEVKENFNLVLQRHGDIENLLTPAPLSIALLGQLILLSLETDFSLEVKTAVHPPKLLNDPGSLRASLLQVSHAGWNAFNLAHTNMDAINLLSATVPTHVDNAVKIIVNGTKQAVKVVLPKSLKNIERIARDCTKKSRDVEQKFVEVMCLVSEMLELCTSKKGEHEQEIKDNNAAREAAEAAKLQAEREQQDAKKEQEEMKEYWDQTKEEYKKAMDEVPDPMTFLGMSILNRTATIMLNTAETCASIYTRTPPAPTPAPQGYAQPMTPANEIPQKPAGEFRRSSENLKQLKHILESIQQYFATGSDGKKDEGNIGFVKAQAKLLQETMKSETETPLLNVAASYLSKTVTLLDELTERKNLQGQDQAKTEKLKNDARELGNEVDALNLQLQVQMGSLPMQATPMMSKTPVDPNTSSDVVQTAVAQSRMKCEQTSLVMRQAMQQYRSANERSQAANLRMQKLVSDIAKYDLKVKDYETVRKILLQGIEVLSQVRKQWSKLVQYFQLMANIIEHSLGESLHTFVESAENEQELRLGGCPFEAVVRDSLYVSASKAYQISYLVQRLSATYVEVSKKHIMPPLAELDTYMALDAEKDNAKIKKIQTKLDTDCKAAAEAVGKLVKKRHEEILEKGYERIEKYEETMRAALPPPTEEEEEKLEKMREAADKPLPVGEDGW